MSSPLTDCIRGQRQLRRLVVTLIGINMLLGVVLSARADIAMQPMIAHVSVHRGTRQTFDIAVANSGDTDFRCHVGSVDITQNEMGVPVSTAEKAERGCAEWLTFKPSEFVLTAGTNTVIKCTIRAPFHASGAYYAFASVLFEATRAAPPGAGVINRLLNSVVMAVVTGTERLQARFRVESVGLEAAMGKPWQAAIQVSNTGNLHARVHARCTLATARGSRIEEGKPEIEKGYILAGCTRTFRVVGKRTVPDGSYMVRTIIEVEGSHRPIIRTAFFTLSRGEIVPEQKEPTLTESDWFMLQPDSVYFELPPRGRRSQALQVMNLTNESLKLEPRLLAWSRDEQGNVIFPDQPDHGRFLPDALTVRPATITVRPGSRQNLTLTFVMPEEAEGEYYVALALAPPGQELPDDPDLLAQRTALVTAQAPKTVQREAVIASLDVKQSQAGGYDLQVVVENTGNCRCAADGQIEIVQGAETIARLSFGSAETLLLPAGQRKFTINWPRVLEPGGYRAIATVRYAEGEQAKKDFAFSVEEGTAVSPGEITEESTAQ